jgi:hypothetical protein
MMAERSGAGSRWETGCGTAPTAQAANMLSTNPIELGRLIVTVELSATVIGDRERLRQSVERGAESVRERGTDRTGLARRIR